MGNFLRRAIDSAAFRLGYKRKERIDFTTVGSKDNLLHTFYRNIKSIPFIPRHIVDVGANHGTWTREALNEFPDCKFTLLEPQAWLKDSIKDLLDSNPNISFNAVGAGKQSGFFKFTILERDDSCSFGISETEAREKGYKQIEVPVVTINELIKSQGLSIPDIIKIDAEGLDIDVLEGASDFFGKTEVFMVEAGVVAKMFPNSLLNVINYMAQKNYRLFEITDLNRPFKHEVLWLVELVFVKNGGIIDSVNWDRA